MHLSTQKSLFSQLSLIKQIVDLPEDIKINLYIVRKAIKKTINIFKELSPNKVERIKFIDRPICNEPCLLSGIILVVEKADIAETQMNDQNKRSGVQEYFRNLYNQIEVEVHINLNGIGQSKLNSPTPPIRGKISLV